MSKVSEQVKQLEDEIIALKKKLEEPKRTKQALLINRHGFEKRISVDVKPNGEPYGPELMVPLHSMCEINAPYMGRFHHDRMVLRLERSYGELLIYREI